VVFHLEGVNLILVRCFGKSTSATAIATWNEVCLARGLNSEQVQTEWGNGTENSKLQCSESSEALKDKYKLVHVCDLTAGALLGG